MAAVSIINIDKTQTNHPIHKNGITAFPTRGFDITIGDTYNVAINVYVGVTGDVIVIPFDGDETGESNSMTFTAFPAGQVLPVQVRQVVTSGTTATNLSAVF